MTERLSSTTHGDAPLSAAHNPDPRSASLWATAEDDELIGRTMTINRPADELRAYLREPAHLPALLGDEGMDWPAVSLQEEPDALSWHTTGDGRQLQGRIEFRPAPAGRGTEVTVLLATEARGVIGTLIDKLTQDDPRMQSRRALRRFKQLMETGEISTSRPGPAAPRA